MNISSSVSRVDIRLLLVSCLIFGLGFSFSSCYSQSSEDVSAIGVVPADVTPLPSVYPTTDPVAFPTAVPTPTAIVLPEPTPLFGPTWRPTSIGITQVLTAKDSVYRPTVYEEPNGEPFEVPYHFLSGSVDNQYDWFKNPTYFQNSLALRVMEGKPGDEWAKVMIPTRPIITGWVKSEDFTWSQTDFYVKVNVANNSITVWEGDVIIAQTHVVTGDSGRETPLASTFIDEILPGHSSAYGPWILSLGVFSDKLNSFGGGGLPKTAIHGTNNPSLIGQYASNGCIRIPNEVISFLKERVPVGTPVDIVNEPNAPEILDFDGEIFFDQTLSAIDA